MSNMRVVHLSPMKFGSGGLFGGGERYPLELARFMADEVPTRLVTFANEASREQVGNLEVVTLGAPYYLRGQKMNPLHSGIFEHVRWATVVHCHQKRILTSPLVALFGRMIGRKMFVTDHGGVGTDISAHVPAVDRVYQGFLHVSQFSRKLAHQEAEPRARVIYGGVDLAKFSPDPAVPREPMVAYVGRLLAHKGIDQIIAALPDGLALELIGRPYSAEYHSKLKALAVGKDVRFREDCDDSAVVQGYRRALCVVLPSVFKDMYGSEYPNPELLGQTLLEGMACGTPAICTDVASMPELVVDGQTGFVVPPHDPSYLRGKLEWLRDHPDEAARMGQAARARVESKFSWPTVVRRCLDAYQGLPTREPELGATGQPPGRGLPADPSPVRA